MEGDIDAARKGWAILKEVTPRAWLEQPAPHADFEVFRRHHCREFLWNYTKAKEAIYPHCYDKRAARLGAAAGVNVGVGAPLYQRNPVFLEQAGLWHLHITRIPQELQEANLPPLFRQPDTWEYSPIVSLLGQLGYGFTIEEAYLFPEKHQALRPFYNSMKLLRQSARTPASLADVKRMYTKTFGTLAHLPKNRQVSPTFVYRPDWYYTLVAYEKANMFRQLLKVYQLEGLAPRMVHTDCLWYDAPVASLPIGAGIGQFKYNQ